MATAYHMVHYRLFTPPKVEGKSLGSLEKLCRDALGNKKDGNELWKRASDRIFDFPQEVARKALLNKVADLSSAIFGELCLMQSDGFQALLELKASNIQTSDITTAEIFNLAERQAPSNSQFIRGMAYWLAIGNHFFFVKTQSMSAEHIRLYIEWLLKTKPTTFPDNGLLKLQAEFDRSTVAGDIGEIKSLRVSGSNIAMAVKTAAKAPDNSKNVTTRVKEYARGLMEKKADFEQAVPIVEAIFGPKKAQSLLDSLGPNEYLSVDAAVKVRGRRTEESRNQMSALASELADITDGKVQVEGKDGNYSDDDAILRTRMPFNLPHEGSNFLEFENVADQLQEVYTRFVKDGKIVA